MLETYVDYVTFKHKKNRLNAIIHLSTTRGDKADIKISETGVNKIELMTEYLSKYASGMYSKDENRFIAMSDFDDSMQGYEPYHLNYCPEYIEREFRNHDDCMSGYTFGSRNPIYGDKIKANWTEINYDMSDDGFCTVSVALYDEFGSFIDVYPGLVPGTNAIKCVLYVLKDISSHYYYSLEDGIWDIHTGKDDLTGPCYDIDLEVNDQDILDLQFRDNEH